MPLAGRVQHLPDLGLWCCQLEFAHEVLQGNPALGDAVLEMANTSFSYLVIFYNVTREVQASVQIS